MGTKISYKQILLCPLGSHHPGAVHSTLQSAGAVHNVQCTVLVQFFESKCSIQQMM